MKLFGVMVMCVAVTSCSSTPKVTPTPKPKQSKEYFPESEYGVKASPRVVQEGNEVPKGGGRFLLGKSYTVKGRRYVPKMDEDYNKTGLASWYGSAFHGRKTANGEVYDKYHLSAAHPTMPLPSYARVTNTQSGSSVVVRVNDRGPFHAGRIMDVSSKVADLLDMKHHGTAHVQVQYIGRAPLEGDDTQVLLASYSPGGSRGPANIDSGVQSTEVMVASLGNVPIPMNAPVMNSTQTALMPNSTFEGHTAINAVYNNSNSEVFLPLPEYGPIVYYRPEGDFLRLPTNTYAAAYVGKDISIQKAEIAFSAVLAPQNILNEQSIVEFALKNRAVD